MEEVVVLRNDLLEDEYCSSVSIGGKVGRPEELKNVNFHRVNSDLDRETSYGITHSILELQEEPIEELRRVENYIKR